MSNKLQQISESDRSFLLAQITPSKRWSLTEHGTFILFTIFGAVVYSGLALIVIGVAAQILGFAIVRGAWRGSPVTYWGAILIVLMVSGYIFYISVQWLIKSRQSSASRRKSITADLERGLVKVEDLAVQGIKLLQEQEHHTFIYLLRLSNGKTLVLYDYDSYDANDESSGNTHPTLMVREKIALRSFPISKLKTWEFLGEEMPLPAPIALVLNPEKWPEDETWCRVKWENIEHHFGPKALPQSHL